MEKKDSPKKAKETTEQLKNTPNSEPDTDMAIKFREALQAQKLEEQIKNKRPNTKSVKKQKREAEEIRIKKEQEKEAREKIPFNLRSASKKKIEDHQNRTKKIQERVDRNNKEEELFFKKRTSEFYNEYKEGSILINKKDNSEYQILKTPTKKGDQNFIIKKLKKENTNGVSLGKITLPKKIFLKMIKNKEIAKKENLEKTISNPENKLMEKMLPVMYLNSPHFMRESGLIKEDLEKPWFKDYIKYLNSGHPKILEEKNNKGEKIFNEQYFIKEWPQSVYSFEEYLNRRDFIKFFQDGTFINFEKTIPLEKIQKNPKLKQAYEEGKKRAIQTIQGLKKAALFTEENLKNTEVFGKLIYHNYTKYEDPKNRKIVSQIPHNLAIIGLKALGYDTFIEFNPKNKTFHIFSSNEEIVNGVKLDLEKEYLSKELEIYPNSISHKAKEGEELNQEVFLKALGLENTTTTEEVVDTIKLEEKNTPEKITDEDLLLAALTPEIVSEEKEIFKPGDVVVFEGGDVKKIEKEKPKTTEELIEITKKNINEKINAIADKYNEKFNQKIEEYREKTDKILGPSKKEEDLKPILLENNIFKDLNPIQQSIVLQETRKIILDKIETESIKQDRAEKSKTPYEKNAGIFKKIFSTIGNIPQKTNRTLFGNYYLAKIKKNLAEKYLHGEEFEKIKAEVAQRVKEEGIDGQVLENGKISIHFLRENMLINPTEEEKEILNDFNKSANEIMLYSYEQENKDKKDEIWEKSRIYKNNKNDAMEAIFKNQIKNGLSEKEAIEYATSIIAKTETQVTLNRFFEQHPEAEKELEEMSKEPSFWKNMLGSFVNKQKGINFAIGGTIRATTASAIGAWTAPLAGLAIGGLMGYKKSVKGIQEDDFLGKRGENQSKKTDKNFREIIDESNPNAGLAQKLNNLSERISQEKDENKKAELVRMLENRIAFTMEKLSKEEVSFGTGLDRVMLQNELANSLAKAEALKFISITELANKDTKPEKTFWEVSDRVYDFLKTKDRILKKTRNWKIAKDTASGALMGAVFAEVGYQVVDYIKTHDILPSLGFGGKTGNIDQNNSNVIQDNKNINIPAKNINTPDTISNTQNQTTQPIENNSNKIDAVENTQTNNPAQTQIVKDQPSAFVNTPKIKNIEVKASSLGAIQTINDLKNQILSENKGSLTNLPKGVQNILTKNSTEIAKELGLFNPDDINEGSMVGKGSTMSINEEGEVILRDVKTGKDFVLMDKNGNVNKYDGEMFDSDANKTIEKTQTEEENPLKDKPSKIGTKITENKKDEIFEENPLKSKEEAENTNLPKDKTKRFIFQEENIKKEPAKARFKYNDDMTKIEGYEVVVDVGWKEKEAYINQENINSLGLERFKQAELENLLNKSLADKKILDKMDKSLPETEYLRNTIDKTQKEIIQKFGDVIQRDQLITPYEEIVKKETIDTNVAIEKTETETSQENEPYAPKTLSRKELVNNTFENNLKKIIKNKRTNLTWESIKDDSRDLPAHKIMSMDKNSVPERLKPFYNYLMQLKEVTRLKPIKEDEFNVKNETSEEFIKRALEKAVRRGKIEKLTL